MKKIKIMFLILIAFILTNCGSSQVNTKLTDPKPYDTIVKSSFPKERPSWTYSSESVKNKYPELELFIGVSDFSENEYDATKAAETDAIDQIIKYKGIYVESEYELEKTTVKTSEKRTVTMKSREEIKQLSKNYAEKLRIIDKYVETGNVYEPRGIWKAYTKVIILYGIDKQSL